MELLKFNQELNINTKPCQSYIVATEYLWGTDARKVLDLVTEPDCKGFDLVIGCDIVYDAALITPLIESIKALSNENTVVLMTIDESIDRPDEIKSFHEECKMHGLVKENIDASELHPQYVRNSVQMFTLKTKEIPAAQVQKPSKIR